jgi:pyruvate formate lyase activating enzyme
MQIGGFQETSLLDYPETISAIIWTVGCNFNCPFCYNPQLVNRITDCIDENEILTFLKKRKGLIEGLSISGGEPLLQNDIIDFIKKVKKLDYLIKIDTNGSFPEKLQELFDKKLVDYVSMDVKAPMEKYNQITGVKIDIKKIEKSIEIIKNIEIGYEFRTTIIPNLLVKEDIVKIAKWLRGSKKYYLQQFKTDIPLISSSYENMIPYPKEYLIEIIEEIKPYFNRCDLRGV